MCDCSGKVFQKKKKKKKKKKKNGIIWNVLSLFLLRDISRYRHHAWDKESKKKINKQIRIIRKFSLKKKKKKKKNYKLLLG